MSMLGEKITLSRQKAGMNKSQLARAIGVTPTAVTDWENGIIKMVSAKNLLKLSKFFKTDPDWFLEPMKPPEPLRKLNQHEMLDLLSPEDLKVLERVMQAMLNTDQYRK